MGLNETVSAERIHIGFFGMRNAGKSSLVNAVTNQPVSIVSPVKGTTTDPVTKAMELLPLGPVLITDTPGIDDEGELGEKRVETAKKALASTDIAVLAVDALAGYSAEDRRLIALFEERKIPYTVALTKLDLLTAKPEAGENEIYVSSVTLEGINELKERIGAFAARMPGEKMIIADVIGRGACAVLVIPIDASAPKGRLILPQQQVLRELLDNGCRAVCCRPEELADTLAMLREPPAAVITDSQAFAAVAKIVPRKVPLTSFSILFARYKGNLPQLVSGAEKLASLHDGDRVLISEGCTHHRQCEDIGTVKIPRMIENFCGAKPAFSFTSGKGFPDDPGEYSLIVHCGGCMLSEKEMAFRMEKAAKAGVPCVNYGVAIAHMNGILRRCLSPFEDELK